MEDKKSKQAVMGFKIVSFQSKKKKDGDSVKLILEADVDGVSAGDFDLGDIFKALHIHQSSDTEIGLSVFMTEEE
jgi:hypothetical protein